MKKITMNSNFLKNKTSIIAAAALLSVSNISAQTFTDFQYKGNDKIYNDNPLKSDEFYSPILQGCYPDPSITKKGEDYYLVNSSFSMFPGVPIFTSKDLVNWKQVGHVLDRPSQLKVEKGGVSHGIYAPDIKYNKYNDTFYMITTQIAGGIGNMVVKTKDPAKGWSEVQKLNFDGIDPAIFFDDDGKAYIVHNDAPPKGTEQYQGHRVIKIWDYDLEKDQVVAGSDKIIVNGGVDLSQKPIWIEGPHLYKYKGKYYLMCAEGGTGGNHSEVIFMADSPKGPFVPAKNNPILTQRYFPRDRKEKVDWAGHADLVEGPNGQWYGVFLAIRPNVNNRVTKGRETFILPVDWSGTYPVFQNGLVPMKPKLKMPQGVQNQTGQTGFFPNGNFTYNDKLTDKNLDFRWIAMRGPRENFITATKTGVKVNPMETNIKALAPVSALFHRLQHEDFETSVTLDYKPKSEKELAGITLYQSETFNYVFGITKKDKDFYIVLERTEKGASTLVASEKISLGKTIKFQVTGEKDNISFNYATDGKNFKNLGGPVSGDILSTDVAGGFTGSLIGLYSTSSNDIVPN
ncbi:MAG: glycoside hydrolase family 43 protein [Chryseobacterium sp.]|nr:glycoside hydrolase family 43 protein [Chryseobacterium sp.]